MAEPSDSAAPRAGLRASDADRDQAIERLKSAFVLGMLDNEELDVRVGLVLVSRTRAGLDALTSDIADQVAPTAPAAKVAQPQQSSSAKAGAAIIGTCGLAAVVASADFGAPVVAAAIIFSLLAGGLAALVVATIVRTILLIEGRAARRGGGQLPPSSGDGDGDGGSEQAIPAVKRDRRRRGQPRSPSSLAISMR